MYDVVIYTDGGARGNPGPAGAGAVVVVKGKEVTTVSKFLGKQTNNWAEYEALILALEAARTHVKDIKNKSVAVRMDSELIVKQMNGEYKVKEPTLKEKHMKVRRIIEEHFDAISFSHVRREQNERADELANHAMDKGF